MLGTVGQDLRYGGFRSLLKQRRYTTVALLTLARGIGANAAVFSVVYGVLGRPLPYADPDRLVWLWDSQPGAPMNPVSLPELLDWRRETHSFGRLAAIAGRDFTLSGREQPVPAARAARIDPMKALRSE